MGVLSTFVIRARSFVLEGFCPRGFCPKGFCPKGFCPRGVLSVYRVVGSLGEKLSEFRVNPISSNNSNFYFKIGAYYVI